MSPQFELLHELEEASAVKRRVAEIVVTGNEAACRKSGCAAQALLKAFWRAVQDRRRKMDAEAVARKEIA